MNRESTPLIIALEEEIGEARLFTGRGKDLDFFLDWVDRVEKKIGNSQVILARKRRGKTALVQRLFNILYTQNNPRIIPFYFRVPEGKMSTLDYCKHFSRSMLSQILGFRQRKPEYVKNPPRWEQLESLLVNEEALLDHYQGLNHAFAKGNSSDAWELAREAGHHLSIVMDVRIIQIIDEFQFLNKFFYRDENYATKDNLATFYQKTGSSKVSPQIITGSYVGWLTRIVNHMVGRYFHYYLEGLPNEEALACVRAYSEVYNHPVTEESAAYLAAVCHNDPYYIASLFQHHNPDKDLRDEASIRATLDAVTNPGGDVASMWGEYVHTAFERINDRVAKKAVLYLAHHDPHPRTRQQILEDCGFDLDESDLEDRLKKLAYADIIQKGQTSLEYQGLGDPIFAMVFRKQFQSEIDGVPLPKIRADIEAQMKQLKGRISYYKGMAAEERVAKKLVILSVKKLPLKDYVLGAEAVELAPFTSACHYVFQLEGGRRITVDIFCQGDDGPDLVVEVKDWEERPGRAEIDTFIGLKKKLEPHLTRPTHFLFHSETPLSLELQNHVISQDLWYCDGERLKDL